MFKNTIFRRMTALVLTLALAAAAALPGLAVYPMPIQTASETEAVYLFNADTGKTILNQNAGQQQYVASLTKLMTALLLLESGKDLNGEVTVPTALTQEFRDIQNANGTTMGLRIGETVRRIDLLNAMLIVSANDAASVIAYDVGGSVLDFVKQMNARAEELGCTGTNFTCAHGLFDYGNVSTAQDLAKIAAACAANQTFAQVAGTASYVLPATNLRKAEHTISSSNSLMNSESANYREYVRWVKGGFTTLAGRCIVAFAEKDGQYTFLKEQMINDGGPGTPFFEAEMLWLAADAGLTSLTDAAPEELLSQLYDGSGGRFLTYLSAMSETDRQTVCRKLDTILQGGTAEQQSLYLDAVQTMAWCSHSFDGAQREAYDYFLEHSARSSQAAYRAQAVMDALTGGGAVQMRLEPADGVRGGDYTVGVSDGSGAVRAQGFSGSFYWATASDSDPSGSSITLQSPDGRCTITAWENSSIVRCEEPGETAWLMAASTSSAPYDGNTVFTYLRKWYDEAEFNALVDRLIVPADGRNREELAQSWLDAVGDVTIHQVTPGSKYENSFVQNRVTVESAEPAAGLYDPELLAGQHFTFTNERIFVPGNYRSKEQQTVNSSARAYHGEYGPMPGGGAFLDTRSGLLYQTADGWKGTFAP